MKILHTEDGHMPFIIPEVGRQNQKEQEFSNNNFNYTANMRPPWMAQNKEYFQVVDYK